MFRCSRTALTIALLAVAAFGTVQGRSAENDGIVRVASAVPVEEAAKRIKLAVAEKGIVFFEEIDQAKLAAKAGVKLRPSILLAFGNPPLGTQFSTANPNAGLDWPVRLLLTEDESGHVWAVYSDFGWIARRHRNHEPRRTIQDRVERGSVDHLHAPLQIKMRAEKFDVFVIGGGNAGIAVTGPTRAAGMSVAIIENRDFGGTCPNRGCTPKKVLVAAGHALHEIERASAHCISVPEPKLDWPGLIGREKRLIRDIPDRLEGVLRKRGVELIRGEAAFISPNVVRIEDAPA